MICSLDSVSYTHLDVYKRQEQRRQQMRRFDELMIATHGEALGVAQGQLQFNGQFVHAHRCVPLYGVRFPYDLAAIWGNSREVRRVEGKTVHGSRRVARRRSDPLAQCLCWPPMFLKT